MANYVLDSENFSSEVESTPKLGSTFPESGGSAGMQPSTKTINESTITLIVIGMDVGRFSKFVFIAKCLKQMTKGLNKRYKTFIFLFV